MRVSHHDRPYYTHAHPGNLLAEDSLELETSLETDETKEETSLVREEMTEEASSEVVVDSADVVVEASDVVVEAEVEVVTLGVLEPSPSRGNWVLQLTSSVSSS